MKKETEKYIYELKDGTLKIYNKDPFFNKLISTRTGDIAIIVFNWIGDEI